MTSFFDPFEHSNAETEKMVPVILQEATFIVEAFNNLTDSAISSLCSLLKDSQTISTSKLCVIQKFCELKDKVSEDFSRKIRDGLVSVLVDKNPEVRKAAAKALAESGEDRWQECIKGEEEDVVCLAQTGDMRILQMLLHQLEEASFSNRELEEALGKIGGSRAVDELIDFLHDPRYRDELIPEWGSHSDDPIPVKDVERARERGFFLREAAAIALGKIGNKKAIEVLLETLNDNYSFVCEASAKALGRIGDKRSVDALIEALKFPLPRQEKYLQWQRVRANAAEALGKICDPRAVNGLIVALKDEDDNVRFQASNSLYKINKDRFPLPSPYENSELKRREQYEFLCDELRRKGERANFSCQYEEALDYFEEALENDPNNGEVYYQRAETLQRLNRSAEADLWYKISYLMRRQDSFLELTKEMLKD